MKFRSYDALRVLDAVAKRLSMTDAAHDLSRSKGAVSYQINKLESELGFVLFDRTDSGLVLTDAGRSLWHVSQGALAQIDREIADLRGHARNTVTVGALTYFAARRKDSGDRCDVEAGMAKLLAARIAWSCADNALQVHGGNGFALEYPVSRILCDARILNIFEGAAEIQADVIARRLVEPAARPAT